VAQANSDAIHILPKAEQAMRYKVLGRHTGLRVSELTLGAGMYGTKWGHGADPEESRRVFDGYVEAGGNFLDTSDAYQFGESESGSVRNREVRC
jgi:aryl-alcohol dehydrogenase-like predicted oxidoreductase